MFPNTRRATSNLHIVMRDHICENTVLRCMPESEGVVKLSYWLEFTGPAT